MADIDALLNQPCRTDPDVMLLHYKPGHIGVHVRHIKREWDVRVQPDGSWLVDGDTTLRTMSDAIDEAARLLRSLP